MIALCLSGGGFRATLFHLGALRRLNELGVLSKIASFSSVSGGSILNGVLASRWSRLAESEDSGIFQGFNTLIADPMRAFCKTDLRTSLLVWKRLQHCVELLGSCSLSDLLAKEYARRLSLDIPLSEVPAAPNFIFCAADMATGVNWRFEAGPDGRMGDYRLGMTTTSGTTVAQAVAASSASPVAFPLLKVRTRKPQAWLSDGAVYDNLGMEPVWKTHSTLLVSDAGQPLRTEPGYRNWQLRIPFIGWAFRIARVFDITDNQVGAVRKRWLIEMFRSKLKGTYWGIGTDYGDYELADARGYSSTVVALLKCVRTDLNAFTDGEIGCLENHGYALADTAMRRWVAGLLPGKLPDFQYPYPDFVNEQSAKEALADSASPCFWRDFWRSLRG